MDCPSCGRKLGDGSWKVCPGCGADLAGSGEGRTMGMPPVPPGTPPPGRREHQAAYPGYRPPHGRPYADPATGLYRSPYPWPGAGGTPYYDPARGGYVWPYPDPGAAGYGRTGQPAYPGAYPRAAKRGSFPLGILAVLTGAAVAGSTFLPWVSLSLLGGSLDVTGWSTMNTGLGSSGSGFQLLLVERGTVFFTGFFSLLLGALVLLCGVLMIFRRRGAGAVSLLFSLAAASIAAVNITMVYAQMQTTPGAGLWVFAGSAAASLVIAIAAML